MTNKPNAGGRKAAGNHEKQDQSLQLVVVDNRPDTGPVCPGAKAR